MKPNAITPLTKPVVSMVKSMLSGMSPTLAGTLMALIGIVLIMAAITGMGKLLKRLMVGRAQEVLKHAIGRGPLHGITSGAAVTVLVQSSSTTTSLMVPFVGNGLLSLREVYPFTLGANIGTCITALLAATAISGHEVFNHTVHARPYVLFCGRATLKGPKSRMWLASCSLLITALSQIG